MQKLFTKGKTSIEKRIVGVLSKKNNDSYTIQNKSEVIGEISETSQNVANEIIVNDISMFKEGYIVGVSPNGDTRVLYRPESKHNSIFVTPSCDQQCLMCPQPPRDIDDNEGLIKEQIEVLKLISVAPQSICITGGEPTLFKNEVVEIISIITERFPETEIILLTNGRAFKQTSFVNKIKEVASEKLLVAIPLYSDDEETHDKIVQSENAFVEAISGIYNLGKAGILVEVRTVMTKMNSDRLEDFGEFIYRNFPFVCHVAFMGMEGMGLVKKHFNDVWINPLEYMNQLERAATVLFQRRMPFSIYNLPLCFLPNSLWFAARQSISDYKNDFPEVCTSCKGKDKCCGLFSSTTKWLEKKLIPFCS